MGQVLDLGACISNPSSCQDGVVDGAIYNIPSKEGPSSQSPTVPSAAPEPPGAQLVADIVP